MDPVTLAMVGGSAAMYSVAYAHRYLRASQNQKEAKAEATKARERNKEALYELIDTQKWVHESWPEYDPDKERVLFCIEETIGWVHKAYPEFSGVKLHKATHGSKTYYFDNAETYTNHLRALRERGSRDRKKTEQEKALQEQLVRPSEMRLVQTRDGVRKLVPKDSVGSPSHGSMIPGITGSQYEFLRLMSIKSGFTIMKVYRMWQAKRFTELQAHTRFTIGEIAALEAYHPTDERKKMEEAYRRAYKRETERFHEYLSKLSTEPPRHYLGRDGGHSSDLYDDSWDARQAYLRQVWGIK